MIMSFSLLRILVCALLFSSSSLFGQAFQFEKDKAGVIVRAYVNNCDISTAELKEVAEIKTLKSLELGWDFEGVDLEKGALSVLAGCQSLEYLQLCIRGLRDEDLVVLPKLKGFKSLVFERYDLNHDPEHRKFSLTDKASETLGTLENLEQLVFRRIESDFSDEFIQKIAALPKLTYLEVSSARFTDRALEALGDHPKLNGLTIGSPQFTDRGVQALARLPALDWLQLSTVFWNPSKLTKLTKESLHALAPVAGLEVLELPIKEVDREALAVVAGWKKLHHLTLPNAEIGDEQFEALRGHPSLESLYLGSATLTEKSEAVVQSMKALKHAGFGDGSRIRKVDRALRE